MGRFLDQSGQQFLRLFSFILGLVLPGLVGDFAFQWSSKLLFKKNECAVLLLMFVLSLSVSVSFDFCHLQKEDAKLRGLSHW